MKTLAETTTAIRDAYSTLTDTPDAWIALWRLRNHLGEAYNAGTVNEAIRNLEASGEATLAPEANTRLLTDWDHWAAVKSGNQWNHLIAIS